MAQIKLNSEYARGRIVSEVARLSVDAGHFVNISNEKEHRRLSQNALYWVWIAAISSQTRYEKDKLHKRLTRSLMSPIYLAKPIGSSQIAWAKSLAIIEKLLEGADEEKAKDTTAEARELVSTTWATVEQFGEYLAGIETMCMARRIKLPCPEGYKETIGSNT